jgi:D-proline reductase (dithiol) PrdB
VGVLSHVLEQHGLATVGISLIRGVTEKLRPPRALFCEFPLGRPLGRPGDPAFQHRVLAAALGLLRYPTGPILEDFPERIAQDLDQPLACDVPPRDGQGHPAAAEARGLLPAYQRSVERLGRTNVGRFVDGAGVPDVLESLAAFAAGSSVAKHAFTGADDLSRAASDIRAFYEEVALSLSEHVPAAGQVDVWVFEETAAGALLKDLWTALRNAERAPHDPGAQFIVPRAFWPQPSWRS